LISDKLPVIIILTISISAIAMALWLCMLEFMSLCAEDDVQLI